MKILSRLFKRLPLCPFPYKPYMHKYKCIFIHIPKNAGSSIMDLLGDTGGRFHLESKIYLDVNDYFFRKYHKFAIVREPLDRLFSAYQYSCGGGNKSPEDIALAAHINSNSHNFTSFIECVLDTHFIIEQPLFRPQYSFIYHRGKLCIDTILRFEQLHEQWPKFAKLHCFPFDLRKLNSSKESDFPMLEEHHYKKIVQMYLPDYIYFNYPVNYAS